MSQTKNFIDNMLIETRAYQSMEQIENDLQAGQELNRHPVLPLFDLVKKLDPSERALVLPRLSKSQRQAFLDLDFWVKDKINIHKTGEWLQSYASCPDENIRYEFVESSSFLTFFKGRFNIWTFDHEDPEYPDHDYYFLTEDNLLLVEYDEEFLEIHELKSLMKDLYSDLGVDKAYSYLFKYVSESFSLLEEEEYQIKKSRLNELGVVDYFDSLEFMSVFPNEGLLLNFIKNRQATTGNLDSNHKSQTLFSKALAGFKDGFDNVNDELSRLEDEKRIAFLKFDFIRLINSKLSFDNAFSSSNMRIESTSNITRDFITLGFNFVKPDNSENIFEKFLFSDLYKIGNSLIQLKLKQLKKDLVKNKFEDSKEAFLGSWLNNFLDSVFSERPKVKVDYYSKNEFAAKVDTAQSLALFNDQVDLCVSILPYINKFYESYSKLCDENLLSDSFYINYDVAEIDFEAIIISSYINFQLGHFDSSSKKMGVTLNELKSFVKNDLSKLSIEKYSIFLSEFGLDKIQGLAEYMDYIFQEHLLGYNFNDLRDSDYKHIGGPIILIGH